MNREEGIATKRLTRRQTLALALGGIALSCPFIRGRKAMANATPDTVVYVSNAGSKEVHAFAMNRQNGELGVIEKAAVPGTDKPSPTSMPLAVAPDHRFLYAALRSEPYSVASFAIDRETGRLNHLSVAPLADSMAYIVTDRAGRYLLSASYPGSKLAINPIDVNGRVDGKTTQVIPTQPKAHCIVVDRATSIATRRASAATSSCNGSSIPRPAPCRQTHPTRSRPSPATGRGIWPSTPTGASST
jgi:hypothetical protein